MSRVCLSLYIIATYVLYYNLIWQTVLVKEVSTLNNKRVAAQVDAFLQASGLENVHFTIEELVAGARRAGYPVMAEVFQATRGLRGVLVKTVGDYIIFYPAAAGYLALHTVAHELAHVLLNHPTKSVNEASRSCIYTDEHEQEAEAFARMLMERWQVAGLRQQKDPGLPRTMDEFFHSA